MTALTRGLALLAALEKTAEPARKHPVDELAAPQWQFEEDTPFGKWRTRGPSLNEYRENATGHVYKHPMTNVVCECGNAGRVRSNYLALGKSASCGCTISEQVRAEDSVTWAQLVEELEERTA